MKGVRFTGTSKGDGGPIKKLISQNPNGNNLDTDTTQ